MNYLSEWQESCVDEKLTQLNVTVLDGTTPSEYLLYSEQLQRRNDGRVADNLLKRYQHTEAGGWWCSGIDVLTGQDDVWGCFKPNLPRLSADNQKLIKYEHPPQTPTGLFALRVPFHLWQRIAKRFRVGIIRENDSQSQGEGEFWSWLMENPQIPLCITEGAKKAGALLTAGYAAIALPGVHNGYRTPRDEEGNRIGKSHLIPQLEKLAKLGREVYIVFDQDSKPATVKAVNAAIRKLGYLLTQAGCKVKVVTWDSQQGKGVDDLIANYNAKIFDHVYAKALPLDVWKAQELNNLSYSADVELNCPYLPAISIPETAKLIGIKSLKGTGKTEFLAQIVKQALAKQKKVLVIGHRVKLVEELCQRFGLRYIREIKDNSQEQIKGYGLCIDSLHPHSQAQFDPSQWSDSIVILDEVEQVLWHGLNSDTCKSNRVAILTALKALIENVLGGDGKVYLADANLSDISLDYLLNLAGINLTPYLINNSWKPDSKEAAKVYNYSGSSPKKLVKDLVKHIQQGGKPFVCLSAQKLTSKWGTLTLEAYLKQEFPLAKILRIDSESLAEPSHPAYNCITNLNTILKNYDIVLASPSIETGISIDIKGHFTSVWAIGQGIQTASSICQSLARIREPIPRCIWIANYGFNQVGNGSTSIPSLLTSGQRLTQLNIRLLQQADFLSLEDFDTGFQAESLLCWAKMAVRVNATMINYRESVLAILRQDNHQIIEAGRQSFLKDYAGEKNSLTNPKLVPNPEQNYQITEVINAVREQNYQSECQAIADAKNLRETDYNKLKKSLVKTVQERRSLRKYEIEKRYGIPVDANLVKRDDQGWYNQLRIHYFLTVGRCFLADRDGMIARKLLDQGQGNLFLPDFNGSQMGAIIGTMEVLGIPVLLADSQRQLRNTDTDLKAMTAMAIRNRNEIKTVMGIGLAKNSSPIIIIRRLLDKIGYGLSCLRSETIAKKRVRVYQIVAPNDGREEVFKQWLIADQKYPGSSELWFEEYQSLIRLSQANSQSETSKYIQLSLNF